LRASLAYHLNITTIPIAVAFTATISNKEVIINANIAILEAKKATLRAKLYFITIPASFICKDPVPFKHIIKLTPLIIILSYIAFIAPSLIKDK
jgi:hypothetical protein